MVSSQDLVNITIITRTVTEITNRSSRTLTDLSSGEETEGTLLNRNDVELPDDHHGEEISKKYRILF